MKSIDTAKERSRIWYLIHHKLPEFMQNRRERVLSWRNNNPKKYLLQHAKARAKNCNVPLTISTDDIVIPNGCPALNVPFKYGTPYAMSIDRIVPELGYIKGNVQVLSRKANLMKQDASKEELRSFANWILKQ